MLGFNKSHNLATLVLLFMIMVASSCSEKITSVEEQRINLEIRTSLEASGQVTQASAFVLTVTGPGIMEPIVAKLVLSNGLLTGSIVVPAGPDRLFRIDAFDEAGTLIYSGKSMVDVPSGSALKLDIELTPRVPMIKVSPMYLETLQGDLLAMKIRVYNLPDIATLNISLSNYLLQEQSVLYPSSIIIDPELAKVASSEIGYDMYYAMHIDIALRNNENRLVDKNGYAEIATVYYQTHENRMSLSDTATFTPAVQSMTDKPGIELPTEQIRAENSVVQLYDYDWRHVAFWEMGYGEGDADIYDQSRNSLNGTATGTTVDYGARGGYARYFNGTSDYVEVPDNALLDIQDELTISMWVYVAVGAAPNPLSSLICKRTKDGPINYQLLLDADSSPYGYKWLLFRYGSSMQHTYRVEVPDNRTTGWFHVLFSYRFGEPSSAMMAVGYGCWTGDLRIPGAWITGDGRESAPNTSGALFMGKDNASTANYFLGGLDEVELFDIVWTPGLIQHYLFTGCR